MTPALLSAIPAREVLAGLVERVKMIIDACKPFAWKDTFAPVSALAGDEAHVLAAKWGSALRG